MTLSLKIQSVNASPVTVHKHVQDGVEGYLFRTYPIPFFLPEDEADRLARYMLFSPRGDEGSTPDGG